MTEWVFSSGKMISDGRDVSLGKVFPLFSTTKYDISTVWFIFEFIWLLKLRCTRQQLLIIDYCGIVNLQGKAVAKS